VQYTSCAAAPVEASQYLRRRLAKTWRKSNCRRGWLGFYFEGAAKGAGHKTQLPRLCCAASSAASSKMKGGYMDRCWHI